MIQVIGFRASDHSIIVVRHITQRSKRIRDSVNFLQAVTSFGMQQSKDFRDRYFHTNYLYFLR